jgi:hypothetical protein
MADSEKKPGQPETPPAKPETTTEIVLHHISGAPVTRIRGAGGKYVKQKTTAGTSKGRRDVLRNFLDAGIAGPDGKFKRGGKSRFQMILDNQIKNAMMDPEQPVFDKLGHPIMKENGKPLVVVDPKIMMASTQAFKEIMLRADGKYATSEEDLEAQKLHGVKIVVIEAPSNMVNREVIEEKTKEKLTPSFIEGEFSDPDPEDKK